MPLDNFFQSTIASIADVLSYSAFIFAIIVVVFICLWMFCTVLVSLRGFRWFTWVNRFYLPIVNLETTTNVLPATIANANRNVNNTTEAIQDTLNNANGHMLDVTGRVNDAIGGLRTQARETMESIDVRFRNVANSTQASLRVLTADARSMLDAGRVGIYTTVLVNVTIALYLIIHLISHIMEMRLKWRTERKIEKQGIDDLKDEPDVKFITRWFTWLGRAQSTMFTLSLLSPTIKKLLMDQHDDVLAVASKTHTAQRLVCDTVVVMGTTFKSIIGLFSWFWTPQETEKQMMSGDEPDSDEQEIKSQPEETQPKRKIITCNLAKTWNVDNVMTQVGPTMHCVFENEKTILILMRTLLRRYHSPSEFESKETHEKNFSFPDQKITNQYNWLQSRAIAKHTQLADTADSRVMIAVIDGKIELAMCRKVQDEWIPDRETTTHEQQESWYQKTGQKFFDWFYGLPLGMRIALKLGFFAVCFTLGWYWQRKSEDDAKIAKHDREKITKVFSFDADNKEGKKPKKGQHWLASGAGEITPDTLAVITIDHKPTTLKMSEIDPYLEKMYENKIPLYGLVNGKHVTFYKADWDKKESQDEYQIFTKSDLQKMCNHLGQMVQTLAFEVDTHDTILSELIGELEFERTAHLTGVCEYMQRMTNAIKLIKTSKETTSSEPVKALTGKQLPEPCFCCGEIHLPKNCVKKSKKCTGKCKEVLGTKGATPKPNTSSSKPKPPSTKEDKKVEPNPKPSVLFKVVSNESADEKKYSTVVTTIKEGPFGPDAIPVSNCVALLKCKNEDGTKFKQNLTFAYGKAITAAHAFEFHQGDWFAGDSSGTLIPIPSVAKDSKSDVALLDINTQAMKIDGNGIDHIKFFDGNVAELEGRAVYAHVWRPKGNTFELYVVSGIIDHVVDDHQSGVMVWIKGANTQKGDCGMVWRLRDGSQKGRGVCLHTDSSDPHVGGPLLTHKYATILQSGKFEDLNL